MAEPITRKEMYLAAIAGEDTKVPDYPITREEQYLAEILENGGTGGGGTGRLVTTSDGEGNVTVKIRGGEEE